MRRPDKRAADVLMALLCYGETCACDDCRSLRRWACGKGELNWFGRRKLREYEMGRQDLRLWARITTDED